MRPLVPSLALLLTACAAEEPEPTFEDVAATLDAQGPHAVGWTTVEVAYTPPGTDTARTLTFLGSDGAAYTMRVGDVPATTGHGKPLQSFFSLTDGAKVVGMVVHDPAHLAGLPGLEAQGELFDDDSPPPPHVVALTRGGRIVRLPVSAFEEPSNKNGRMYARLNKGDEVLAGYVSGGAEFAACATANGHVLVFPVAEANVLKAAGKGTLGIKLGKGDEVLAFELSASPSDGPVLTTTRGRTFVATHNHHGGSRAAKGRAVIQRGGIASWQRVPHVQPPLQSDRPGGEE